MSEEVEIVKHPATEPDSTCPAVPSAAPETAIPDATPNAESTPPVLPTPKELDALRQAASKSTEHYDAFLRARAELDNFRKRSARERQDAVRFASQGLFEKLIPVLDSFEMAMTALNNPQATLDSVKQGITMVQGQLKSVLTDAGVQEINAIGQPFDPNFHEAVSHAESLEVPDGHVVQQLRRGYRLHERLVRPATVIIAKPPGA